MPIRIVRTSISRISRSIPVIKSRLQDDQDFNSKKIKENFSDKVNLQVIKSRLQEDQDYLKKIKENSIYKIKTTG